MNPTIPTITPVIPLKSLIDSLGSDIVDMSKPFSGYNRTISVNILGYLQQLDGLLKPTTTEESYGSCKHGTPFCYFCERCREDDEPQDHAKAV